MKRVQTRYSEEEIRAAVAKSDCYANVFRNLGISVNGGSYKWVKEIIKRFNIETNHFDFDKSKTTNLRNLPKRDYKLSLKNGKRLKAIELKKHLDANSIQCKCSVCSLSEWMNKPITLDIDHKNGNCDDNSLENLQYLCPNCHRQKTGLERKAVKKRCGHCGCEITSQSISCRKCFSKHSTYVKKDKINWPDKPTLEALVWSKPLIKLAIDLGVTDNAIRKRCLKYKISLPKMGHWQKEIRPLCSGAD